MGSCGEKEAKQKQAKNIKSIPHGRGALTGIPGERVHFIEKKKFQGKKKNKLGTYLKVSSATHKEQSTL